MKLSIVSLVLISALTLDSCVQPGSPDHDCLDIISSDIERRMALYDETIQPDKPTTDRVFYWLEDEDIKRSGPIAKPLLNEMSQPILVEKSVHGQGLTYKTYMQIYISKDCSYSTSRSFTLGFHEGSIYLMDEHESHNTIR